MGSPKYRVDTSPLWWLLVKNMRRVVLLSAALGLYFYSLGTGGPDGLSLNGYRSLCILGLAVFLWSTTVIPAAITGILVMVLVSTFVELSEGVTAYQLFGSQALFFLLGSFILSASLRQTGLSNRIALNFMVAFARSPRSLFAIVYGLSIVLSYFMISHGVAALLLPIVLEILMVMHTSQTVTASGTELDPESLVDRNRLLQGDSENQAGRHIQSNNFSKLMLLGLSFGCAIGGLGSILGSGRVTIVLEYMRGLEMPFTFIQYSLIVFPLVVVCALSTWFMLRRMYPIKIDNFEASLMRIRVMHKNLGPVTLPEAFLLVIVAGTLLSLALLTSKVWTVASIMLMASILIFVFNLVDWSQVERSIDWGIIFMFGGAIVLGSAVSLTDGAGWLVHRMGDLFALKGAWLLLFFLFSGMMLSQILSNSAVMAAFLPVTGQFVIDSAIPGLELTEFTVALSSILGLAAALPISSPTAALVFSTGYFKTREMFTAGLVFSLLCFSLFLLLYRFFWPVWSRWISTI